MKKQFQCTKCGQKSWYNLDKHNCELCIESVNCKCGAYLDEN